MNTKIQNIEIMKNIKLSKTKAIKLAKIANILDANKNCIDYSNEKKYFQAPFESLREYSRDESPLVQLNSAIILQSIIDCTAIGESRYTKKIREEARNWIFSNCKDFQDTCINANLYPEFVIKLTKQIMGICKEDDKFKLNNIKK